jgi:hypothetical protein
MICVSGIIFLDWIHLDDFIASFVMFAIAAPFLLVNILHRDQWWALIPGGIMAVIGVALFLDGVMSGGVFWSTALILLGIYFIYRAFRAPAATPAPPVAQSEFDDLEFPDPAAQPDEPR